jgi:hypothetical protein
MQALLSVLVKDSQLILFAVFRLGYLGKPKAFQKNASHPFCFFNTR